jgi:prolyl-tRNA synthetase
MRRDQLWRDDKVASISAPRADFVAGVAAWLEEIQGKLFDEAKARLDANVRTDIATFDQLAAHFGPGAEDEDANVAFKGWVRCAWSKPTGDVLEEVTQRLKSLKLTIRNAPMAQPETFGPCLFTGQPGVEEILIARAY